MEYLQQYYDKNSTNQKKPKQRNIFDEVKSLKIKPKNIAGAQSEFTPEISALVNEQLDFSYSYQSEDVDDSSPSLGSLERAPCISSIHNLPPSSQVSYPIYYEVAKYNILS